MFYLMMHSTLLRLYGIKHMVKDHSVRGNPLPPQTTFQLLELAARFFICIIPDRITHTTAFVTSRGALAGMT